MKNQLSNRALAKGTHGSDVMGRNCDRGYAFPSAFVFEKGGLNIGKGNSKKMGCPKEEFSAWEFPYGQPRSQQSIQVKEVIMTETTISYKTKPNQTSNNNDKPDVDKILTGVVRKLYVFQTVAFFAVNGNDCYQKESLEGFFWGLETMTGEMIDQLNELRSYIDRQKDHGE